VVLPGLSESYGSSADPPEPTIPVCTLKSFPYLIEHTLQWARDAFEGDFTQAAESVNQWLERDDYLSNLARDAPDTLPSAVDAIHAGVFKRPDGPKGCVRWARERFDGWFDRSVRALCAQFPADHLTESGQPFWSGTRRRPTPTPFDAREPSHAAFVRAAARLRARTLGLPPLSDKELDAAIAAGCDDDGGDDDDGGVEEEAVASSEAEAKAQRERGLSPLAQKRLDEKIALVRGPEARKARARAGELRTIPESFEKDDDANGHMEFVTCASNLRAANYGIPPADTHRSKLIAGRIVPAIATTTACVVGLSCLELLKLAHGADDLGAYRNGFLNLGLPLVAFSEPTPAEDYPMPGDAEGGTWNLWSRVEVEEEEELTLKELVDRLEDRLGLEVSLLSSGSRTLYSSLTPPAQQEEWLKMGVRDVVGAACGLRQSARTLMLQVSCYDEDEDEDVEVPTVAYRVR
jgi:ubiquitin-activating enzyme E1